MACDIANQAATTKYQTTLAFLSCTIGFSDHGLSVWSPLVLALCYGHADVADLLVTAGATWPASAVPRDDAQFVIWRCVRFGGGDVACLARLAEGLETARDFDGSGESPLIEAAKAGLSLAAFDVLVPLGHRWDLICMALVEALKAGNAAVATRLGEALRAESERPGQGNATDPEFEVPEACQLVALAARSGDLDLVRTLVENQTLASRWTPCFLDFQAYREVLRDNRRYPLTDVAVGAVEGGNIDVLRFLLTKSAGSPESLRSVRWAGRGAERGEGVAGEVIVRVMWCGVM